MEESVMAKIGTDHPEIKPLLEQVANQGKQLKALQDENAGLKLTAHCRGLLESAERSVDDIRITALKALTTDETRKALIETWAKVDGDESEPTSYPRPAVSPTILESAANKGGKETAGDQADSCQNFANRLKLSSF
jgi:hypothetical protein